jgi:pyruvate dehydrogenase E1 component
VALGTDGFGRSDTRAALRNFFEVDRNSIALAALAALTEEGAFARKALESARNAMALDPKKPNPWTS